jgi:hypothetical protein
MIQRTPRTLHAEKKIVEKSLKESVMKMPRALIYPPKKAHN